MKIEPRGKYPGVKLHLDGEECMEILQSAGVLNTVYAVPLATASEAQAQMRQFYKKVFHAIRDLMKEKPNLLEERTKEEIETELKLEAETAALKLNAIKNGKSWKGIKPEWAKEK